jgi:GNAT superfamily N-acetyltransferase
LIPDDGLPRYAESARDSDMKGRGSPPRGRDTRGDWRIRQATEPEVERLVPLYEWLFESPGHRPASWHTDRAKRALENAIASAEAAIFVAEDRSEILGLCSAYLDLDSVRYGRRCWVEDLVVEPARRSKGVGSALLEARVWAREEGATHLELDTGLDRSDAQRFYEQEGPARRGVSYSWAL